MLQIGLFLVCNRFLNVSAEPMFVGTDALFKGLCSSRCCTKWDINANWDTDRRRREEKRPCRGADTRGLFGGDGWREVWEGEDGHRHCPSTSASCSLHSNNVNGSKKEYVERNHPGGNGIWTDKIVEDGNRGRQVGDDLKAGTIMRRQKLDVGGNGERKRMKTL